MKRSIHAGVAITGAALLITTIGSLPAAAEPASSPAASTTSSTETTDPSRASSLLRLSALTGDQAELTLGYAGAPSAVFRNAAGDEVWRGEPNEARKYVGTVTVPRGASADFTAHVERNGVDVQVGAVTVRNDVTALPAPRVVSADQNEGRVTTWLEVEAEPGAALTVKNSRGQIVGQTSMSQSFDGRVLFEFDPRDAPSERRFTVTQRYGDVESAATPFHRNDTTIAKPGQLAWPSITGTSIEGGLASIQVQSTAALAGSRVQVGGQYGRPTGEVPLVEGKATLSFQAPTSETRYWVWIVSDDSGDEKLSLPIDVTLRAGVGTEVPAPVSIGTVEQAGTRTIATVSGTPGALVTVMDADDQKVAIRSIPKGSSSVQIALPAAARSLDDLYVTQTTGFVASDSVPLVVPTAP